MNTNSFKSGFVVAMGCLGTMASLAQSGGPFAVPSSVIAGGSGTSTSGVFQVSGTVGQPVTGGPLTNGGFRLASGFWPQVHLLQLPDGPPLKIRLEPGQFVISWPVTPGSFRLQTTSNAADKSSWVDSANPLVVVGDENTVAFRPIFNPPSQYFRLRRVGP